MVVLQALFIILFIYSRTFFTGAFVFPIPKFRRCSFEIYRSYLYVCVFRFFIVIISFPFASRPLFRNENFHDKKRMSASGPDPQRVLFLKKNVGNFALIFFSIRKGKMFFLQSRQIDYANESILSYDFRKL